MVGISLSSTDLKKLFDILGLTDNQSKVYLILLSAGTSTLGQINQLTGLNYLEVQEALEVLIGSNFVGQIQGKVGRYYSKEPFLKSFLLAYDPITLVSISTASKRNLNNLSKKMLSNIDSIISEVEGTIDTEKITNLKNLKQEISENFSQVSSDIDQEISALSFSIKEMKARLNYLLELSKGMKFSSEKFASLLATDIVHGEAALIVLLKDMTLRTKASLTILMPQPAVQTLVAASKLTAIARRRTIIVGDFNKIPKTILRKILDSGVRLRQMEVDFWACIRDSEELMICPLPDNPAKEGFVGITSINERLVQFFNREIMSYTTKGRDLILSDFN